VVNKTEAESVSDFIAQDGFKLSELEQGTIEDMMVGVWDALEVGGYKATHTAETDGPLLGALIKYFKEAEKE
jgi:hypothetical protein